MSKRKVVEAASELGGPTANDCRIFIDGRQITSMNLQRQTEPRRSIVCFASAGLRNKSMGFTLVELMITVAIIGILASVGYPSYLEHVRSSRRSQARADLMELAQLLERNFTNTNRYNVASPGADGVYGTSDDVAFTFPFTTSPRTGTAMYNITNINAGQNTFTLKATRTGGQAQDKCGELTLTQAGVKAVVTPRSGVTATDCW